jgi:hypothetical protein
MSNERFFRNSSIPETSFFDEGPRIPETKVRTITTASFINSSSIDTSEIDAYRQGVELTQQKHFDKGIVKIHAGEPGHVLAKNRYGMDKNFRHEPWFEELTLFNPVEFLKAQEIDSPLYWNIITFPIITGDNDQIENYWTDGIIEAMPIREVASFFSIDAPFQARDVRAGLMSGNEDQTKATEQVLTVDTFDPTEQFIPYLDLVDLIDGQYPTTTFFQYRKSTLDPFVDRRNIASMPALNDQDDEMKAALSAMTGSFENYVDENERSATSGWVYDNNASPGTDSVTFGGQVY